MRICRILYIIVIVVTMSLVLVWERKHTTRIGYRISNLQKHKIDLIEGNRKLKLGVSKLLSGDRIAQVMETLNMDLAYAGGNENKELLFSRTIASKNTIVKEF